MRPKEIQELIDIVEKSNISELVVSRWWKKVVIRKNSGHARLPVGFQDNIIVAQAPATPAPAQAESVTVATEKTAKTVTDEFIEIKSPMVGTFYRAPAPEAEPYVKVGDKVAQGQVLCIIEAMKLMNEIEAEFPCRIVEIATENAQPVEYNQPLFKVEKV